MSGRGETAKRQRDRRLMVYNAGTAAAAQFAGVLRHDDVVELHAATGLFKMEQILINSIRLSAAAWAVREVGSNRPIMLGGMSRPNSLTGEATIWMVATDLFDEHYREICRRVRSYTKPEVVNASRVTNFIDARNERALRFAKWLGARISEPAPHGPFGLPFHHFVLEAK